MITDDTLTLGTMKDSWPSSQYENGQWTGISIDIYRTIFSSLNEELDIAPFDNYPRIIGELTAGNIDIGPNFRIGKAPLLTNPSIVCTDEFYLRASWGAYALSDSGISKLDHKSGLESYHVGSTRVLGLNYLPELKDTPLTLVRQPNQLLRLLHSKRINLVIISENTAKAWNTEPASQIEEVLQLGQYYAHLCFSKPSLGEAQSNTLKERVDNYLRSGGRSMFETTPIKLQQPIDSKS